MTVDVLIEIGGTTQRISANSIHVDGELGTNLLTEGEITLREHSGGKLELVTSNSE